MKKITQEQINTVVKYLLHSPCPSNDVQAMINLFRSLPSVDPEAVSAEEEKK